MRSLAVIAISVAAILATWIARPADAWQRLYDRQYDPVLQAESDQELVISGLNKQQRRSKLFVRIDDSKSRNFATRSNEERLLPPGPFTIRLPLSTLKESGRSKLDHHAITRIMVFQDDDADIDVHAINLVKQADLPGKAMGWDFGPADSPVFPGFSPVNMDDPRLTGSGRVAKNRPYPDMLIGDGISGIRSFTAAVPNGDWTIHIWTEDTGEWEFLPHALNRFLKVNDTLLINQKIHAKQWLDERYFAGRNREALVDGDIWDSLGRFRGGHISGRIKVTDNRLNLSLSGDGMAATHIAAILLEPGESTRAFDQAEMERKKRFLEIWRSPPVPDRPRPAGLSIYRVPAHLAPFPHASRSFSSSPVMASPGQRLFVDFHIETPARDVTPQLVLESPLPAKIRFGHMRWERPYASQYFVHPRQMHLRGDVQNLSLTPKFARRVSIEIDVPERVEPGIYSNLLKVYSLGKEASTDLVINVLPTKLPEPRQQVGVYLEESPHLTWFPALAPVRENARWCDLLFLRQTGLTFLAPPFRDPGETDAIAQDLQALHLSGFTGTILAYTPAQRLSRKMNAREIATHFHKLQQYLPPTLLDKVTWSIADEPTNIASITVDPLPLAQALRKIAPDIRLAGHLNHRPDRKLVPLFDDVFVNHGFGVDRRDLEFIKSQGARPWMYNLDNPRSAAGFYLWKVRAEGYIQWHGRMPTADPFDTTDGREADFQFLYPSHHPCAAVPDMHHDLAALSEGITDLKWLTLLDQVAEGDDHAYRLIKQLQHEIPDNWADMTKLPPEVLDHWRRRIQVLFR